MIDCNTLDHFVAEIEQHEQNLIDLDDLRFGEIYLNDKQEESYDFAE